MSRPANSVATPNMTVKPTPERIPYCVVSMHAPSYDKVAAARAGELRLEKYRCTGGGGKKVMNGWNKSRQVGKEATNIESNDKIDSNEKSVQSTARNSRSSEKKKQIEAPPLKRGH